MIETNDKPNMAENTLDVRAAFRAELDTVLAEMLESGQISQERASEKRQAAELIDNGLTDVKYDALLFAKAGFASEEELIQILNARRTSAASRSSE